MLQKQAHDFVLQTFRSEVKYDETVVGARDEGTCTAIAPQLPRTGGACQRKGKGRGNSEGKRKERQGRGPETKGRKGRDEGVFQLWSARPHFSQLQVPAGEWRGPRRGRGHAQGSVDQQATPKGGVLVMGVDTSSSSPELPEVPHTRPGRR